MHSMHMDNTTVLATSVVWILASSTTSNYFAFIDVIYIYIFSFLFLLL